MMKRIVSVLCFVVLLLTSSLPTLQKDISVAAAEIYSGDEREQWKKNTENQEESVNDSTYLSLNNMSENVNSSLNLSHSVQSSTYESVTRGTYDNPVITKYLVTYASKAIKNAKNKKTQENNSNTRKVIRSYNNVPQELIALSDSELSILKSNPNVVNIEPDYSVSLLQSGLTTEGTTFAYDSFKGNELLYDLGADGHGIKVGIIDSGIDLQHPDLRISGGISFIDDNYGDQQGHGTEVAGIIGAQINDTGIKGIAPNAELYSLKVFNVNGTASHSDIIAAIDWAIENKLQILNMSFGGKENGYALQQAVQAAWQAGILLVGAAGNEGISELEYPAKYPSVMAIGAVEDTLVRSSFSNYGDGTELVAYGNNIKTTTINSSYRNVTGTSFAAAYVTASAAALWSIHPEWSSDMVRKALLNSSVSIGDQNVFGYGLVNPLGAVKGQLSRDVSIDFNGTVSGAVYGNLFAKLSYLNKTPSQDPFIMKQGEVAIFSVVSEDDINDYYTGVFDSNNNKIFGDYVPPGESGIVPKGSVLSHRFVTDMNLPVGNYKIKIAPCFEVYGGDYDCPIDSAIFWSVTVQQSAGPDTVLPGIEVGMASSGPYYQNRTYSLLPNITDNVGVKSAGLTVRYGVSPTSMIDNQHVDITNLQMYSWTPRQIGYYSFVVTAYDTSNNLNQKTIGPIEVNVGIEPHVILSYTVDTGLDPQVFDSIILSASITYDMPINKVSLKYKHGISSNIAENNFEAMPWIFQEDKNVNLQSAVQNIQFAAFVPEKPGYYMLGVFVMDGFGQSYVKEIAIWVGPDTITPVVQSIEVMSEYLEQYKSVTLRGVANDNGYMKKMVFWYTKEQSPGNWGPDTYIGEITSQPNQHDMNSLLIWNSPEGYGYYSFVVVAYDEAGNSKMLRSPQRFWINAERTPPSIAVDYDRSSRLISGLDYYDEERRERVVLPNEIPLLFSAYDNSGIKELQIKIYKAINPESEDDLNNNNTQIRVDESVINMLTNDHGRYLWNVTEPGWYRISLTAQDYNGNRTPEVSTANSYIDIYVAKPTVVFVPGFLNSSLKNKSGEVVWPPDLEGISLPDREELSSLLSVLYSNMFVLNWHDAYNVLNNFLDEKLPVAKMREVLSQLAQVLILDEQGDSVFDLELNGIIKDNDGSNVGELINFLTKSGIDVIEAPYDWRLDVAGNEVQNAIDIKVKEALQKTHGQPISLLTYSMGALPTRKYILDHQYDLDKNIESLTNIAPPNLGTFYGFKAIDMGDDLHFLDGLDQEWQDFISKFIISPLANNMTSVYDLIPGRKYSLEYENQIGQASFYSDNMNVKTYSDVVNYINQNENFIPELYQKSYNFRNYMEDRGNAIDPNINQYRFVGYKRYYNSPDENLRQKADTGADIIGMVRKYYRKRIGGFQTPIMKEDNVFIYGMGDSVVPLKSAAYKFEPNTSVYYAGNMHSTVVSNSSVDGAIQEIVAFGSTTTSLITNPADIPTVKGSSITIECPVTVAVYDAHGNYAGLNEYGQITNNIPELNYDIIGDTKTMFIPEGVDLQVKINGYDTGTMNMYFIDYDQDKPVTVNTLFDVNILKGTHATFEFNALIDDNADLNITYDYLGNGDSMILHPEAAIPFDQFIGDITTPVTSISSSEQPVWEQWYAVRPLISMTAYDHGSGVDGIYYQIDNGPIHEYSEPFLLDSDGIHLIQYYSVDKAGNAEEIRQLTLKIDTLAPETPSIHLSTPAWTNQDVTVQLQHGTDNSSGIQKSQYKIGESGDWTDYTGTITVTTEGIVTIYGRTLDKVGNMSKVSSVESKIDKSKPQIPIVLLSKSGWSQNDVTVQISGGSDTYSGVKGYRYKLGEEGLWQDYSGPIIIPNEGITPVNVQSVDHADNASDSVVSNVLIDRTPPTIPGTTYIYTQDMRGVKLRWEASQDNLSPITYHIFSGDSEITVSSTNEIYLDSLIPGKSYEISIMAVDAAGNVSVRSGSNRIKTLPYLSSSVGGDPNYTNTNHTVILKNDGEIWTWGNNKYGQLGDGTFLDKDVNNPVKITPPAQVKLKNVAADLHYNIGIDTDNNAWVWGGTYNLFDSNSIITTPRQVMELSDVRSVSSGRARSLFLKNNGSVYAFGSGSIFDSPELVSGLSDVKEISSGACFDLALKENGTVWAWGCNSAGQLGQGSYSFDGYWTSVQGQQVWYWTPDGNSGGTPTQVNNLSSVVKIAAGAYHALALKEDGTLWSWGYNEYGILGDNITPTRSNGTQYTLPRKHTPSKVYGDTKYKDVAASQNVSVAVDVDGNVWAWGGINGSAMPIQVAGISNIVQVIAGENQCYAIRNDGMIYRIWDTSIIELIAPFIVDASIGPKTPDVTPTSSALQIGWEALRGAAAYDVEINGAIVETTGINYYSDELPSNTSYDIRVRGKNTDGLSSWSPMVTISTLLVTPTVTSTSSATEITLNWVAVPGSIGYNLKVDGVVIDSGLNTSYVHTGLNPGSQHTYQVQAKSGVNTSAWSSISNPYTNLATPENLALSPMSTSVTVTWTAVSGATIYQLDVNGTIIDITGTSYTVNSLQPNSSQAVKVRAKNSNCMSSWSQLKTINTRLQTPVVTSTSMSTEITLSWTAIPGATGYMMKVDGADIDLGLSTTYVHTGLTPNTTHTYQVQATSLTNSSPWSVVISTLTKPIEVGSIVSAGNSHSVYVTSNGTLRSWGNNYYGQLGNGGTANSTTSVQVSGLSGMSQVVTGYEFNVALKSDGTVWTWGYNLFGQLGSGATYYQRNLPETVQGLTNVTAVAAGLNHGMALKNDGTVWAWGDNGYNQLGDGTTTRRTLPVQVTGINGVVAIAAGSYHSMALKSDGTVWAWGNNTSGQLGNGTNYQFYTTAAKIGTLSGITKIAAGNTSSYALKSDGTIWVWGSNGFGQLGDGSTTNQLAPVQLSGVTNIKDIKSSLFGGHTIALKNDGTVWAWGKNDSGQLGDGTLVQRLFPVQVSGLTDVKAISAGSNHSAAYKNNGTIWSWGSNGNGELGDGTTTRRLSPVQSN